MENNFFTLIQGENIVWFIVPVVIAIIIFALFLFLELRARKSPDIIFLEELLRSGAFLSPTILSITIGLLLIIAGIYDYFLSPSMPLNKSIFDLLLVYSEILIGVGFILGSFVRLSAVAFFVFIIAGLFKFHILDILDFLVYIGIALYLFFIPGDTLSFSFFFRKIDKNKVLDRFKKYAYVILRVVAGLSLIYISFHHLNIFSSEMVQYLDVHPKVNFIQSVFGISSFSNLHFIFSANVAFILFGALLALGFLERIVSICVAVIFVISIIIIQMEFFHYYLPYFAVFYAVITGNQYLTSTAKKQEGTEETFEIDSTPKNQEKETDK